MHVQIDLQALTADVHYMDEDEYEDGVNIMELVTEKQIAISKLCGTYHTVCYRRWHRHA